MAAVGVEELDRSTLPRMESLSPNVYAFVQSDGSWGLSNGGFLFSEDAAVLIDTCFTERRNRALLGVINDVAPGPVKVLVNTHHHGDHTHGNGWFPGATIVSHRSTRDAICELNTANSRLRFPGVDFGELRPTPPLLTFDERVYLNVGDMLLDVFFPGVAHCGGDTVVHLREPSLLFGGDVVMNGCTPGFVGGSAQGYLAVIQQLRALGVERIVPGHGAICEPSVLDEIDGYVRWILSVADEGVAAGYSPLEAARRADLGPFAQWLDHERIVGNLYRAYHEIEGTSIDWSAVWADTEAYLGRPIRSMA